MKSLVKSVVSIAIAGREQSWCIRELNLGPDRYLRRISAVRHLGGVCEGELGIRSARCGEILTVGHLQGGSQFGVEA